VAHHNSAGGTPDEPPVVWIATRTNIEITKVQWESLVSSVGLTGVSLTQARDACARYDEHCDVTLDLRTRPKDPDLYDARTAAVERLRREWNRLPKETQAGVFLIRLVRRLAGLSQTLELHSRNTRKIARGRPPADARRQWLLHASAVFDWMVEFDDRHVDRTALPEPRWEDVLNPTSNALKHVVECGLAPVIEYSVQEIIDGAPTPPKPRKDHNRHAARRGFVRAVASICNVKLPDPDREVNRLLPSSLKSRRLSQPT
jgi:hypothetical protein